MNFDRWLIPAFLLLLSSLQYAVNANNGGRSDTQNLQKVLKTVGLNITDGNGIADFLKIPEILQCKIQVKVQ